MHPQKIVSRKDWQIGSEPLLAREKELTAAHDHLAAARRRAPWMRVEGPYDFQGSLRLVDLFDGHRQLIVFHHMPKPSDRAPCAGCAMVGDQIPHLAHLHQRDTSMAFVSLAPFVEIEAFRRRMGWQLPWFETSERFNRDFDVTGGFGLIVFHRDGDAICRTYFTVGRGVETLGSIGTLLDLTPLGRLETWEESPELTPQSPPQARWRLQDEYAA